MEVRERKVMPFSKKEVVRVAASRWAPDVYAAIRRGSSPMSAIRRVALMHGILPRAMQSAFYRWKRFADQRPFRDRHCLLSEDEEQEVADFIIASRLFGTPLGKVEIIRFARECLGRGPEWRGDNWYRSFRKSHSKLFVRRAYKAIKRERVSFGLTDEMRDWCEQISENAAPRWTAKTLVNVDETLISGRVGNRRKMTFGQSKVEVPGIVENSMNAHASVIPFVRADGEIVMVVFVLNGSVRGKDEDIFEIPQALPTATKLSLRTSPRTFCTFSPTGRVDGPLWKVIAETFAKTWKELYGEGLECHVIMDNLGAHRDLEACRILLSSKIYGWFIPANSSHITQPLDNVPFAELKKQWYAELERAGPLQRDNRTILFLQKALRVLSASLTQRVVVAGFRNTGIFPWDPIVLKIRTKEWSAAWQRERTEMKNSRVLHILSLMEGARTSGLSVKKLRLGKYTLYDMASLVREAEERELQKNVEAADIAVAREKKKQAAMEAKNDRKRKREQEAQDRYQAQQDRAAARAAKKQERERVLEALRNSDACRLCGGETEGDESLGCSHCEHWWYCASCTESPENRVPRRIAVHEFHCKSHLQKPAE